MESTPVIRSISQKAYDYRGPALQQLAMLKQQMALSGRVTGERLHILDNGVTLRCVKYFNEEYLYIDVPESKTESVNEVYLNGIICHPRSGVIEMMPYTMADYDATNGVKHTTYYRAGVAGGWANGSTELDTKYLFPLVDTDHASFVIDENDGFGFPIDDMVISGTTYKTGSQYGNLYWRNSTTVLSWRGTPTRHFALDKYTNIPGFSIYYADEPHPNTGDAALYTAFGPYLYRNGSRQLGPKYDWPYNSQLENQCRIIGACIDDQNRLVLVVLSDQREAPAYVFGFSDGHRIDSDTEREKDTYLFEHVGVKLTYTHYMEQPSGDAYRGTWLMIWREGTELEGYDKLFEVELASTVEDVPWFSNDEGSQLTSSDGSVLVLGDAPTYTKKERKELSVDIAIDNTTTRKFDYTITDNWTDFFEAFTEASFNAQASIVSSTIFGLTKKLKYEEPAQEIGTSPAPTISGPSALTGTGSYPNVVTSAGQQFTASGTGPFTWSVPFAYTKNSDGSVITTSGGDKVCGTITLTVTDACGNTGALVVRAPNGQWVLDHWEGNQNWATSIAPQDWAPNTFGRGGWSTSQCIGNNYGYQGYGDIIRFYNLIPLEWQQITYDGQWRKTVWPSAPWGRCNTFDSSYCSSFPDYFASKAPTNWPNNTGETFIFTFTPYGNCAWCGGITAFCSWGVVIIARKWEKWVC